MVGEGKKDNKGNQRIVNVYKRDHDDIEVEWKTD